MSCNEYSLSELVEIIGGGTPKTTIEEYWNGNINWISIKDFNGDSKYILNTEKTITELGLNKSSTKLLKEKDIIISARGTVGALGVIKTPMAFNQSCYGLRANNKVNSDFLYYLLKNSINILKNNTHGSVFNTITKDTFNHIKVNLPSLEEQEKIANILSSLDDKIELNNEMNKTLEEMAQALFKRWFVDFEFPNEEGMPYKSSGGEMVESELGMIPKEWEVGYFSDISEIHDSKRIPLSKMEREKRENIYPYYGAASLMDYVDDYIFDGVYILMGEDGTVIDSEGYPILQYVYGKFWVNNHAHVLRGKNNFSNEYLYLLLKNTKVSHIVTGAVQPKINQKNLNSIRCVIPSDDILEKFNSMIKSKYEYRIKNEDENKVLREIRDTVLTKLMSGEIRVK